MNSIYPTPWSRRLLSTTHLIFPVFRESRGSRSTLQNNRFDWLVCRSLLAAVILMLCCFTMPSYAQNVRLDNGTPTPPTYPTMQAALAAAVDGNTITLLNNLSGGPIAVTKDVTIDGGGFTYTLNASGVGVIVSANGITIQNLTIDQSKDRGLQTSCGISDLTLSNVTISNSAKTAFNINGVTGTSSIPGATLSGLTATNNGGNGLSISDSKYVTVADYTSSGNKFSTGFGAGVGLFSGGACAVPNSETEGTNNVSFSGTFNVSDPVQLYTEGSKITDITLPTSYTHFAAIKGSTDKFYANSKANAYAIVTLLSGSASDRYVQEITSGNMHVNSGMSIQTAIDVAAASKTVFVEAGNFPGAVNVNKTLTVSGDGQGNTTLSGAADYGIYIDADDVKINDLKVSNATLQGLLTNCGSDNVTITNVTVANSGKTGFNINGVNTATLKNITANNNVGNGLSISDSKNVTIDGLTTSGNAFTGGFSAGVGIFGGTVDGKPGACVASVGPGSSNIKIIGTININEPFKVYQQGDAVSAVTLPYTFFAGVGLEDKYYADSKATAYKMAAAIIAKPTPAQTIYVEEIATGDHFVDDAVTVTGIPGTYSLSIQGAITYLAEHKTVFVEAGTFNEAFTINKAAKIYGAQNGVDPRPSEGSARTTSANESIISVAGNQQAVTITSSDVEFDGFTVEHSPTGGTADLISSPGTAVWSNVKILNNIVKKATDEGIQLRSTKNSTIEKNYIVDSQGDGINMSGSLNGVGNIIQNNEIKDALSSYGAIYLYGIKGVEVRNNNIHGYTLGITAGVFDATSAESVQDIEIHHNRIEGNFPKLSMTNLISVGGNATSNVNVHNNYIKELPNTATNVVFVRIANNVTDVKVKNNYFEKLNAQKYLVFGYDDNSRIPTSTATIDATCNWFGSATLSDVQARVVNVPGDVYVPYLSSGNNTIAAGSLGFEPEANACTGPVYNVQKDRYYNTITSAIQAADPTNTLKLSAYTFTENVVINKPLTLEGATTATSIISGATSYGIYISANNVTVKNLTIANGAIQGLQTSCGIQNLTLTDITATANGKTGFNINGVNIATLTRLIATGNTGNGMSISDSKSVNVVDYTSSGNHFSTGFGAGVGLFSRGACVVQDGMTEGTENVSFSGTFNVTDPVQLYTEGSAITNITLPAGVFTHFAAITGSTDKFYADSKAHAYEIVPLLSGSASNKYVQEISSGNMYVDAGMSVQTAINVAAASKTVFVEAGNFPGAVNVNKTLTVSGAGQGNTTLSGAADYGIYIDADDVKINDLKVSNATLQGLLTNCGSDNVTITDVTVANSGKTGFNINGVNIATLKNITANNNVGNGLSISDSKNVTIDGLTTSGNAFTGGFSAGVGIFSNGACVGNGVVAGTDDIEFLGTTTIAEPFKIYQQGSGITGLTLPSSYLFFVGVGANDKYYNETKAAAYTMAATMIAQPTPANTVYVEEIATGNHYVDDAVPSAGVPGNYTLSIQGAVNYLLPNKTVFLEAGTFSENVSADKPLTLKGSSATTSILTGPTTGAGITITSNDVSIQDLTVKGYVEGIRMNSLNILNPSLTNVIAQNNSSYGININSGLVTNFTITNTELSSSSVGFKVGTIASINGLTMSGSTVKNNVQGFAFAADATSKVENVQISTTTFTNNSRKGIYAEKLSKAVFDNIVVTDNGIDPTYASNNGFSLNLLYNASQNIEIKNSTFSGNGVTGTSTFAGGRPSIAITTSGSSTLTGLTFKNNTVSAPSHLLNIGVAGSSIKVEKNNFSSLNSGKYSVLNTGAANIALVCNWFGTTNYAAIQNTLSATSTGLNVVDSYSTDNSYASCTPAPCNITAVNNSDGGAAVNGDPDIANAGSTRSGTLVFTAPAGYDTYKWYACTTGAQSTCNVPETNTTNVLTRTFAQLGSKGVRLTKTLGGVTTECYFFFKIVPHITTSASTACSIVLTKNGSSGTNQWYKDSSPIPGATGATYTATENGTYYVQATIGSEQFKSADYVVNTITGSLAITTQPAPALTFCQNSIPTNLSVATTPAAASYQWYSNTTNSNVGGTIVAGATSASFAPSGTNAGTYYYYVVATSSEGCTKTSGVSTVTVTPGPLAGTYSISANQTCEGTPITITGAGLTNGVNTEIYYTLTSPAGSGLPTNPPPFTGMTVGGSISSTSPADLIPGMYTVSITSVKVNGCSTPVSPTQDLTWEVKEPTALPATGTSTTFNVVGSGAIKMVGNCEIGGTITSTAIAGATDPSVTLSTSLVNGYRKYTITPAAGSAVAATLTLYFTQADFNAFNAVSSTDIPTSPTDGIGQGNLRILHVSATGSQLLSPSNITWNTAKSWWEVTVATTHFSSFQPASSGSLPVKLVSFKANKESDAVRLNWETTAESNSSHFDVEHSQDGKMWATIGTVKAANNSNKSVKYFLDHKTPSLGQNLYRLKMIDLDATFAYSSIQSVVLENGYKIALYPNPVSDILNLEADNWNQVNKVRIVDMNGRTIYSSTHQSLSKKIDVKSIASGSYVLEIIEKNGSTKTRKFVIMR